MEVVPSKMEVASSKIEVSPFFVDFHDLRTFVAIYILSRFTHFFRQFFLAKIAISATKVLFLMYAFGLARLVSIPIVNCCFTQYMYD